MLALAAPAHAASPEFSGSWQLDAEKSTGVPPGLSQLMTVRQSGDRIEVEVKLSGKDSERTVTDVYVVNGKEAEFTPVIMQGGTPNKGKRTSTWQEDRSGFDATEESTVETPDGTDTIKGKRSWRLSPDGKTLTIEMDLTGGQGEIKSKRVFVRQ